MPITYKNKQIVRFKEKTGGKNNSNVDGFYETIETIEANKQRFFIKKPADQRELFTELFAGLLLREFMKRKLIDEEYFPSLICADVIEFEDHSFGLIQPMIGFDELFKVIGTGTSDRSVVKESLFGPSYYAEIMKQGKFYGLSIALMFSLLLGAHSVHSGNIVILHETNGGSKQFGRIDWGDALRNFAHAQNNDDILYPYENRGINYKKLTKDYFLNYRNIKGIYPAMAEKAKKLQTKLDEKVMIDIVTSALRQIPATLIDTETKSKLADYMTMSKFKDISFGPEGKVEPFATEMAKLLMERISKITVLKDLIQVNSNDSLYVSHVEVKPLMLNIKENLSFEENIQAYQTLLGHDLGPNKPIESKDLDVQLLAKQFNQYISRLANSRLLNPEGQKHSTDKVSNPFVPYYTKSGEAEFGHAFVPQYKDGVILDHLFAIDLNTLNFPRFAPFENPVMEYCNEHPESVWAKVRMVLSKGQDIINTLSIIKRAQGVGMDDAVNEQLPKLISYVNEFTEAKKALDLSLQSNANLNWSPNTQSQFFYPIDEIALNSFTGAQLATICLEELNATSPSPLIHSILSNKELWKKASEALYSGEFNARMDNPQAKIIKLYEWRQLVEMTEEQAQPTVEERNILRFRVTELEEQLKQLEPLKNEVALQKEQMTALKKEHAEALESNARLQRENEDLNSSLTLLLQDFDNLKGKITETNELNLKDREQKQQQINELAKKVETKVKELEQLTLKLKEQTSLLDEKNRAMLELDLKRLKQEELIQSLQKNISTERSTNERLGMLVRSLTDQLEEKQSLEGSQKQILELLQADLSKIQSEKDLLNKELLEYKEQFAKLQQQFAKQAETNKQLSEQVQILKDDKVDAAQQTESVSNGLTKIVSQLKKELSEQNEQVTLLKQQIAKHEKTYELLIEKLRDKTQNLAEEKLKAEQHKQSVSSEHAEVVLGLRKELDEQKAQLTRLELEITQKEESNKLLTDRLSEQTQKLEAEKLKVEQQKQSISEVHTDEVSRLREELDEQRDQLTQLKQQIAAHKEANNQLKGKLSDQAQALETERNKQFIPDDNTAVISRLKRELAKQKEQNDQEVQRLMKQSQDAQAKFESDLRQNKNLAVARLARIAYIQVQIQDIDAKARNLSSRGHTEVAEKAFALVGRLNQEVENYVNSNEQDESIALNTFKANALGCIDQATKDAMNTHRELWKYVVGNLALSVLLLGVGYLAAILINKQVTGNFTFFSQPDGGKKLLEVENSLQALTVY